MFYFSRQGTLVMTALVLTIASVLSVKSSASEEPRAEYVSLINLIATPEKFHGKIVVVSGFVSILPEQDVICLARDVPSGKECLWLEFFDRPVKSEADADEYDSVRELWKSKYHGKVVTVRARFDMEHKGHLLTQFGTLDEITVLSTREEH